MAELEERVKNGSFNTDKPIDRRVKLESIVSYSTSSKIPKISCDRIRLDRANRCLLLPVSGKVIPFNIVCIKNLTLQNSLQGQLLWVNFQTPSIQTGNLHFPDPKTFGAIPLYIKELFYIVFDIQKIKAIIEEF